MKNRPIHYRKPGMLQQDPRKKSTAEQLIESAFYKTTVSKFQKFELDISVNTIDIRSNFMRWAIVEHLETDLRTLRPLF